MLNIKALGLLVGKVHIGGKVKTVLVSSVRKVCPYFKGFRERFNV